VLFPVALMAADTGSAVLRSTGGVWLNGTEVGGMVAIFSGDLLETKPGAVANVDADGSSVLIRAESVVKFNGDSLTLEHGIVSVGTSKGMSVHVDCIRVEPVLHEWTQYDVTNVSGTVQVAARKNDVNIHQGVSMRKVSPQGAATQSVTVHEGQEATRNTADACGVARRPGAGGGGNPKWVEIGVGTGGGILILCLLLCKGPPEQPVSNSQP
jgi:hypothetical protein